MRPSQRTRLLDAALDVVRAGDPLSLESAARAADVTKPGLMYHFPTKEDLVAALVDHRLDQCETQLTAVLGSEPHGVPASRRIAAYVRWSVEHEPDPADLVMMSDPRLLSVMTARWADRFRPWVELPDDVDPVERARLNAVRLLADGCWYADATGVLPLAADDRPAVLTLALELLGDPA